MVASGSGSAGLGGAGSRIMPIGKGVSVGGTKTPGIMALISTTRVARVAVGVGVKVAVGVAVRVKVGVDVVVGLDVVVGVRVGVCDGVTVGSTISVGSDAVECAFGMTSKYKAVPQVRRQSATKTSNKRRIHFLHGLFRQTSA